MFAKAKKHPTNVLLYHFIVCLQKKGQLFPFHNTMQTMNICPLV